MRFANPKNIAIGVLGAAVVGLAGWVAADHLPSASAAQTASLTASPAGHASTPSTRQHWSGGYGFGGFGGFAGLGALRGELKQIQTDIGLPATTILADLRKGETLAQIAGTHAAKLEADLDSAIQAQLATMVSKGALSSAQAGQLYGDAQGAVGVFMNMKLSALAPER